jgi:hypothetical protein
LTATKTPGKQNAGAAVSKNGVRTAAKVTKSTSEPVEAADSRRAKTTTPIDQKTLHDSGWDWSLEEK